jgi:hypothetical protein
MISHPTDESCAFTADAASRGYRDLEDFEALNLTMRTMPRAVNWQWSIDFPPRWMMHVPENWSSVAGNWFSPCCLP